MITYVCKRTVVSTQPVQPDLSFPLSVLDRLMDQSHLRIVYYYQTDPQQILGQATKKLRESLSELLTYFPIMTGRLQRNEEGHWMIKCNDAGVRMVEARAQGNVEEWLMELDREKELNLVYWEEMFHKPYFWSTFYVQLTEFEQGGLAIGLSCTHLLADPICATMFIKAWADKTLIGNMTSPPFFHPLPLPRPTKGPNYQAHNNLIDHYKNTLTLLPLEIPLRAGPNCTHTVAFSFKDKMVRDCMTMSQVAISPFEALATLFWISISKVRSGRTKGEAQVGNEIGTEGNLVNMSICLDARKVLDLDKGYFGNCMVYNKIRQPSTLSLHEAAKVVSDGVKKAMDNQMAMDLIQWLNDNDEDHRSAPFALMNDCDLVCANFEGAESYNAMFEDGFKPVRVSYYVEPVPLGLGQVLVIPSPHCEGPMSRVVTVTLRDWNEVLRLCEHPLVKRFSPTMLIGEH